MHPKIRRGLTASILGIALICALAVSADAQEPPMPAPYVPNDPLASTNQTAWNSIAIPQAWRMTKGSPGVTLAFVDSGTNPDPDLAPNLVPGYNMIDGSNNTVDENGHGTQMAAVAAAVMDNGIGTAGVCPGCKVLPIKTGGANGFSNVLHWTAGINTAVDRGAKVINLSIGVHPATPIEGAKAAIARAIASGVVVVIAAGNGTNNDGRGTDNPAGNRLASENPQAIRVANYSNRLFRINPSSNYGSWVDVAAPGEVTGLGPRAGGGGTSTAAAVVSATIGLMLSCNPALTPAQVKQVLMSTVTPAEPAVAPVASGGIVNAYRAGVAAGCQPPVVAPPPAESARLIWRVAPKKSAGSVLVRPSRSSYTVGSVVAVTAKPKPGWRFVRWQGLCKGTKALCRLKLTRSGTVTAVFRRK